jgi:hypothetical protein
VDVAVSASREPWGVFAKHSRPKSPVLVVDGHVDEGKYLVGLVQLLNPADPYKA